MPIARSTRLPAWALLLAACACSLPAQIDKPPQFEDPSAFISGTGAPRETSTHVGAQAERLSTNLLRLLEQTTAMTKGEEREPYRRSYELLARGMVAAATASFEAALRQHPHSLPIACGYAAALAIAGRTEEGAERLLRLAAQRSPDFRLVPYLGEIASRVKSKREALEKTLRQYLLALPSDAAVHYYLGQLLAADKDTPPAESLALWNTAARLDLRDPRPCLQLAKAEETADRPQAAISWLRAALQRDPHLPEAHYRLGRLYQLTGDTKLAEEHLAQFRALRSQ